MSESQQAVCANRRPLFGVRRKSQAELRRQRQAGATAWRLLRLVSCLLPALLLCRQSAFADRHTTSHEIPLKGQEQARWNTFFSNFVEVRLEPFRRGKLTNQALIDFGVLHCIINKESSLQPIAEDHNKWRLSAAVVAEVCQRYFGKKPTHWTTSAYGTYKKRFFYGPFAAGEVYPFAKVRRVLNRGDGTYRVEGGIYQPEEDGDTKGVLKSKWRALVRRSEEFPDRYVLLEWQQVQ